jgi:hypothetical protein
MARSDPRIVYVTVARSGRMVRTRFARSGDRGRTWQLRDPGEVMAQADLLIAGVDPQDPERLYLRLVGGGVDGLALSEDGGATVQVALVVTGVLQSFLRLPDGTLLASAAREGEGRLYRSRDRGRSYVEVPTSIHPRALAERGGKVYAATDNQADGFALAVSSDGGDSWAPVMKLADVSDVVPCAGLAAQCLPICKVVAGTQTFRPALCEALTPRPPAPPPPEGCHLGRQPAGGAALLVSGAFALLLLARRRPRRR